MNRGPRARVGGKTGGDTSQPTEMSPRVARRRAPPLTQLHASTGTQHHPSPSLHWESASLSSPRFIALLPSLAFPLSRVPAVMTICSSCHVDYADVRCKAKPRVCYQCCSQSANTCSAHFAQMPPDAQKERRRAKRAATKGRRSLTTATATGAAANPTSLVSSLLSGVLCTLRLWFHLSPPSPPQLTDGARKAAASAVPTAQSRAERRSRSTKIPSTKGRSRGSKRTAEAMEGQDGVEAAEADGQTKPGTKRRRRAATDKGASTAASSPAKRRPRSRKVVE